MGSDLYLHNRWLMSGWSEYEFMAIAAQSEATRGIREATEQYFVQSPSLIDLGCLNPDDLYILASLGSRISSFYGREPFNALIEFERIMGYIADWMSPDAVGQLNVGLIDSPSTAMEALNGSTGASLDFTIDELRELDKIGTGDPDQKELLSTRTWLLLGPGPRVFAPSRDSHKTIIQKSGLAPFMADFLTNETWGLEQRLVEVFNGVLGTAEVSLTSCLQDQAALSRAPRLLLELSELTLDAISSGSHLVLRTKATKEDLQQTS